MSELTNTRVESRSTLATDRLARGALAGLVAGIVFAMLTMLWTAVNGPGAMAAFQMIASLPYGGDAPQPLTAGTVVLGGAIHLALSVVYGIVFALLLPRRVSRPVAYAAGAAFGLALYVVNFLILAPLAFEVFQMAHQGFEVVVHVLFGLLLVPFLRLARS